MEEQAIAYHEAAHMVVGWDLGLAVTGATIVPDEERGYLGCVWVPIEDRVRYALFVDEDAYLYSHLVVYFAGPAASEKFTGVPLPDEAVQLALESPGSDHYNAADYILELGGWDPQAEAPDFEKQGEVGDRALRHAENLVSVRWEQVEAVAKELMERETLDATECRRVLENAFHS